MAVFTERSSHELAKPCWKNFETWGFSAVEGHHTGSNGSHENFGFTIKESTRFIEANAWEDIDLFIELQKNHLGDDNGKDVRTGEVYVQHRNIDIADTRIGLKLGHINIPFDEKYLWQEPVDNRLITNSTAYPYGWDEAVQIYGENSALGFYGKLNWIFSITDGTDKHNDEDHSNKAFIFKRCGDIDQSNYFSVSLEQ